MESFKNIVGSNKDFEKRIAKIRQQVVNDPDVKQFLNEHQSELTNAMIDEDLNVLQEYKDQQKHYDGHNYNECPNLLKVMCQNYILKTNALKFAICHVHVK